MSRGFILQFTHECERCVCTFNSSCLFFTSSEWVPCPFAQQAQFTCGPVKSVIESPLCTCVADLDSCASNPCSDPGSIDCFNIGDTYECQCATGYTGMNCEIRKSNFGLRLHLGARPEGQWTFQISTSVDTFSSCLLL